MSLRVAVAQRHLLRVLSHGGVVQKEAMWQIVAGALHHSAHLGSPHLI